MPSGKNGYVNAGWRFESGLMKIPCPLQASCVSKSSPQTRSHSFQNFCVLAVVFVSRSEFYAFDSIPLEQESMMETDHKMSL